jgi:anti-anti-sigma regulatory factor
MNDKLSFSIRKKGNIAILDLYGKITGSRALTLKDELMRLKESGISSAILNFEGVSSIDSLGVMAITSGLESGLITKIFHINTGCREVFAKNRAASAIPIYGSEEEAIGNMSITRGISKEMRRYKRINTNIPVDILVGDNNRRGVILNMSERGALVGYLDHIAEDPYNINHITIIMKLPVLGSIELEGKPLRFGHTGEMHTIGMELISTEKTRKLVKQVCEENILPPSQ